MSENTGNGGIAPQKRTSLEDNLRKVYQDVLNEEIPDRFKALLDQLRTNQKADGTGKGEMATSNKSDADKGGGK